MLQLLADGSITLTTVNLLAAHLAADNHRALLDAARARELPPTLFKQSWRRLATRSDSNGTSLFYRDRTPATAALRYRTPAFFITPVVAVRPRRAASWGVISAGIRPSGSGLTLSA